MSVAARGGKFGNRPAWNGGSAGFRGYGVATTVLGLVAVVAVVVTVVMWSQNRQARSELSDQGRVLRAAAEWVAVLVNPSEAAGPAAVDKLRDNTTGDLRRNFTTVMQPYLSAMQPLNAPITGEINSVSLESVHPPTAGAPSPDTVLVVATTNGAEPHAALQTVRWYLRVGITNSGGRLLISNLDRLT
jgi:hypothetical protein